MAIRTRRLIPTACGILLAAGVLALPVAAIAPAKADPIEGGRLITLQADHAKLQRLSRIAATVVVGNPLIADVSVQSGKLLVITGKNYGTTNLIALDRKGEQIAHFRINVKTNGVAKVTLNKGIGRHSLTCAPRCEAEIQVGDSDPRFKSVQKQLSDKMNVSKGTSESSNSE